MQNQKILHLEKQIAAAQRQLAALGPMRPGTLSRQYKDPKAQTGAYWQLSYTHRMQSRTKYVRPDELPETRRLTANFKRFRRLCERYVELSLQLADLRTAQRRSVPTRRP